jgi:hypothetical protein
MMENDQVGVCEFEGYQESVHTIPMSEQLLTSN